MPSFKERFRPSRKYKKNKEAGIAGTDEPTTGVAAAVTSGTSTNATNISTTGPLSPTTIVAAAAAATTTTSTTIDEHTGSAALSTYHSHHSSDQCE